MAGTGVPGAPQQEQDWAATLGGLFVCGLIVFGVGNWAWGHISTALAERSSKPVPTTAGASELDAATRAQFEAILKEVQAEQERERLRSEFRMQHNLDTGEMRHLHCPEQTKGACVDIESGDVIVTLP